MYKNQSGGACERRFSEISDWGFRLWKGKKKKRCWGFQADLFVAVSQFIDVEKG